MAPEARRLGRARLGLWVWLTSVTATTATKAITKATGASTADSIASMGWANAPAPLPLASRPKAFHASVTLDYSQCANSSWKGAAVLVHGGGLLPSIQHMSHGDLF